MIKSISLTNFQSHASTQLNLDPGLNVITGPSDSGKTAIIRALRWALYNEPRGDSFVRAGAKSCEAQITFADGSQVIRARHGRANEYRITLSDGSEHRFEAFGADPPPEVAQASGMPKVQVGDRELAANFAYQLDGPFLLSESPLVAAKVLGKLAGTEEVDHAARTTASDTNRRRQDERRFAADLVRLEVELDRYSHLPELAARIERLTELAAIIRQAEARLGKLSGYATDLSGLKARADKLSGQIAILTPVARLANALGSLQSDSLRLARLGTLAALSQQNAAAATKARASLSAAEGILKAEPVMAAAAGLRDRLRVLTGLAEKLVPVRQELKANRARLALAADTLRAEAPAAQASRAADRLRVLHNYPGVLRDIAATHQAARQTYEAQAPVAAAEPMAQGATQLAARLSGLIRRQESLALLAVDRQNSESRAARLNQILAAGEISERAQAVRERLNALMSLRTNRHGLYVLQSHALGEDKLAVQAVATYQDSYVELLAEVGICPVCGSKVNPAQIKEVISA